MNYPRNRDIKRRPQQGKHWCNGCDRNHIGVGSKCDLCGYRHLKRKNKSRDKYGN